MPLIGAIAEEPAPLPTPTPTLASCETNILCEFIYEQTGVDWLAESSYYLLVKPFRILFIIICALLLRYAVIRMIKRLTRGSTDDRKPGLLRPLRERMPASLQEATGLQSERRRQRAEALGSVLRSVASVSIFAIAVMLILGELGFNLAPLLASAGIAGVALGFGAQNLVKDLIAGLFMLLEDQYGVGDVVDLGEATGIVEAVGLRITTIRDARGVLWYIRNGEIIRVGNKSQGWAAGDRRRADRLRRGRGGDRRAAGGGGRGWPAIPSSSDDLLEPPDGARRRADHGRRCGHAHDRQDDRRGAVAGRA